MTDPQVPLSPEALEQEMRARMLASVDTTVPFCPICGSGLVKVAGFGATHACIRPKAEGPNHFIIATVTSAIEWDGTPDHDKRTLVG